ncbi:MAG: ATP-binding protein [Desulfobacterales bacterium]
MIIAFLVGYAQLAYFLHHETQSAIRGQKAVSFERKIRSLKENFIEMRLWEKALLAQEHPEADKRFGRLMELINTSLSALRPQSISPRIHEGLSNISQLITEYEKDFNRIVQLRTEQQLGQTLLNSDYQSLTSNVLRINETSILKPLLNLSHFQRNYLKNHRETEYDALNLVLGSLENRLYRKSLMDERLKGYIATYRKILNNDFILQKEIQKLSNHFDAISVKLSSHFNRISNLAGDISKAEIQGAEMLRKRLNVSFIISMATSAVCVLLIFAVMARQIVHPIRAITDVARHVRSGNINARYTPTGRQQDEIVRLGLDFNRMLDTLDKNKEQLITYQNDLENKLDELAARKVELQNHRQHLQELVKERTTDLRKINLELEQEIDIRMTAEEGLRIAHNDLARKASDLEEANKELSQFAYAISHDIMTPLRAIHNYTDFLREDLEATLEGEQKLYLNGLVNAVSQGEELVEDLLELSRISVAAEQIQSIHMGEFLHGLIDMLNLPADVQVKLADGWPSIVTRPTFLRQIFQNLIINATKFNQSSDKHIELEWRPIGHEAYEFCVRDNGIGIDKRYHEQIFRVFQRLHTRDEYEGTGIGLAIVKKAAAKLKGSISIKSTFGKGSSFFVTLPKTQKEESYEQKTLRRSYG